MIVSTCSVFLWYSSDANELQTVMFVVVEFHKLWTVMVLL